MKKIKLMVFITLALLLIVNVGYSISGGDADDGTGGEFLDYQRCLHKEVDANGNTVSIYEYALVRENESCPEFLTSYEIFANEVTFTLGVVWRSSPPIPHVGLECNGSPAPTYLWPKYSPPTGISLPGVCAKVIVASDHNCLLGRMP